MKQNERSPSRKFVLRLGVWTLVLMLASTGVAYSVPLLTSDDSIRSPVAALVVSQTRLSSRDRSLGPEDVYPVGRDDHLLLARVANRPATLVEQLYRAARMLPENTEVIGIEIDGKARAYSLAPLRQNETNVAPTDASMAVLVDVIGSTPISITFNRATDSVRVFRSRDQVQRVARLRYAGFQTNGEAVFLLDDVRYRQTSQQIPLETVPHQVMSLRGWRQRHPDSAVFLGNH
ncbi:MAG: hypothetical protein AAGA03_01430 [Planctomycetota bacterium]